MWFWRKSADLGIDLGTATVLVYVKGKGVILKEPSVVAINKVNNKILAVGEEARKMIGRTPGNIIAVRPLKDGVISDYDITEKMLKEFIKKACGGKKIIAPKVMVCIPSQATEVEKRAVIDATKNSGAKEVYLIEEPLSAAIGAGVYAANRYLTEHDVQLNGKQVSLRDIRKYFYAVPEIGEGYGYTKAKGN